MSQEITSHTTLGFRSQKITGETVLLISDCRPVARYNVSAVPIPFTNGKASLLTRDYLGGRPFSARPINVCGSAMGVYQGAQWNKINLCFKGITMTLADHRQQ